MSQTLGSRKTTSWMLLGVIALVSLLICVAIAETVADKMEPTLRGFVPYSRDPVLGWLPRVGQSSVEHPEFGRFKTIAPPLRMSGNPMSGTAPAPALGADTAAILSDAGVDDETVALILASAG